MLVTRRFTLQDVADGEHQILGHKFLYLKKITSNKTISGVTIDKDGMAILHKIPTPYKIQRQHNPNDVVRCYYQKLSTPETRNYNNASREDRLKFIKSLFPEPSYGLAYKIANK